jgi:multiple sugar transport system substrate-binding protein
MLDMITRRSALNLGATALAGAAVGLPAAASAADITVSYADWQLAQDIWGRSLREAFAEFEQQNPGVKVTTEPVALAQRDIKFTTAIRAGAGPDVFALDMNPVKQYIDQGWVKDLTPFVDQAGGAKYLADFYKRSIDPLMEGGKIYGIPKNVVAMVLVYNEVMFKDAGITKVPETWDEFRVAMKKLTKATKPGGPIDQWGWTIVAAPAGFDLRFSVILRGFGGDFLTPDGKHSALNSPAAKEAFNYVLDMIQVDKTMPPGVAQVDANGSRRMLANKQIAVKIGTTWSLPEVSGMNPALDGWHVLKMAHIPQKQVDDTSVRTTLYEKALFMNPNCKNPEAAWKLIKFMTEQKQMQRWFDDNLMLSARKSVNETYKPIVDSPYAVIVTKEIDRAAFLPLTPKWPEILETFRTNLQDAIARTKTPEQALANAHNQVNAILARS